MGRWSVTSIRRPGRRWRVGCRVRSKRCSTTRHPRVARPICWRSSRSCALTPCWHCWTVKGPRSGRPEIVVVEDHTNPLPDGRPSLDWGVDVDLPHEFLEQLRPTATVYTVTVRNGVVIDAPGRLDLGRETRLANRAQRRALHGLYATCAIPGCRVRYTPNEVASRDLVAPRRPNDLANLLPLCEMHHQKIHHDGWLVSLGANRELTITLPDGQIMTTGPPRRGAA